jgi:hypothetical protein
MGGSRLTAAAIAVAALAQGAAQARTEVIPAPWKNCRQVNAKYPHGVGRVGARDHTTSGDPVTAFKRSTRLYRIAMSNNRGLDRDKDGIACEKL